MLNATASLIIFYCYKQPFYNVNIELSGYPLSALIPTHNTISCYRSISEGAPYPSDTSKPHLTLLFYATEVGDFLDNVKS